MKKMRVTNDNGVIHGDKQAQALCTDFLAAGEFRNVFVGVVR